MITLPINNWLKLLGAILITLGLTGCDQGTPNDAATDNEPDAAVQTQSTDSRFGGAQLVMPPDTFNANPKSNAERNAYFGDLHVHSLRFITKMVLRRHSNTTQSTKI